jgi:hypothetical protein
MDVSEQPGTLADDITTVLTVHAEPGFPPSAPSVRSSRSRTRPSGSPCPRRSGSAARSPSIAPLATGRHRYFDLTERRNAANGRRWDASVSAVIWQQRWPSLLAKLEGSGVELENGQEMLLLASDGGGKVSLHIVDVARSSRSAESSRSGGRSSPASNARGSSG